MSSTVAGVKQKSNFTQRSITGILFVAILICAIVFHPVFFWILFGFITTLAVQEFYALAIKNGALPQKKTGVFLTIILFGMTALVAVQKIPAFSLLVFLPLTFCLFIAELFRNTERPFVNIAYTILGLIYVALPFSLLNFLAFPFGIDYSSHLLLGYFSILWSSDTGAYLTGKAIGKHPLFPRVSPKKTWEGTLGGMAAGFIAAYILSLLFKELTLSNWLIIAGIIVVMGGLGDLVESLFKRSINIKDSGTLLPGHGGLLDRFDGLLLSVPFIWFYLMIIAHCK
jgi:phosphatidate cytidylyltransferase